MTLSTIYPRVRFPLRGAILGSVTGGVLSVLFPISIILLNIIRMFSHSTSFNLSDMTHGITYVSMVVLLFSSIGVIPSIILGCLTGFLTGCALALCTKYLTATMATAVGFFIPVSLLCTIFARYWSRALSSNNLHNHPSQIDEYLFGPYIFIVVPIIYVITSVWGARRLFYEHLRNQEKESQNVFKTG